MRYLKHIVLAALLLFVGVPAFAQQQATRQFTLTVVPANPVTISTTSVPSGVVNVAYNKTLAASGGVGPYTWTVSAGTLPAGVLLSSSGVLSGTPITVGPSNFTIKVTDSQAAPSTATASFSVTIANPLLITTTTLPNANVGQPYTGTIAITGGIAPYTAAVSTGSLPAGLTLSVTGSTVTISGTPTTAGPVTFTLQVTDSATP